MQPVRRAVNNSFDADEELDTDLAEELSRFRSPDTWNKVAQHLDLVWKIGRVGHLQHSSNAPEQELESEQQLHRTLDCRSCNSMRN